MKNDTFLIFGTSPALSEIVHKIPYLLEAYNTCGVNAPLFNYEFIAFGDSQTFNPEFKNKLIVPSYMESTLKTRTADGLNYYVGNDFIIKPSYMSPNEYPLSMFYPLEYAQKTGYKRAVLIACGLKTDKHYHYDFVFSKTERDLQGIKDLIKSFDIEILQTSKYSNLDLPYIDIEDL